MIFRKKQVEVEGFKFYVDNMPDWFMDKVTDNTVTLRNCNYKGPDTELAYCLIQTPGGTLTAFSGDFVIKEVDGSISVCSWQDFEATYELAEELEFVFKEKYADRDEKFRGEGDILKIKLRNGSLAVIDEDGDFLFDVSSVRGKFLGYIKGTVEE